MRVFPASNSLFGGLAEGRFADVGDLDPSRIDGSLGFVIVVPVPPLIGRGLGIAFGRIFPRLLASERSEIEIAPEAAHGFVAAVVDEVGAEDFVAVAEEDVVTVPLVDAEIFIEVVGEGVPGHLPVHAGLDTRDVCLRRARGIGEGGVAGVEMGYVQNLVGPQGAAAAGMFWPAEDAGLKEGAVKDELRTALEQIEQADFAVRSIEAVLLVDGHPRHAAALSGHGVTGAGEFLFFDEQLLARRFPLVRRDDRGRVDLQLRFHLSLLPSGCCWLVPGSCCGTFWRTLRRRRRWRWRWQRSRLQLRYRPGTWLAPSTAALLGRGADAGDEVGPVAVDSARRIVDPAHGAVNKADARQSVFFGETVLDIGDGGRGHEERPANFEQRRRFDGLDHAPEVSCVVAQIAEPSSAGPGFEFHRHRLLGC